MHAPTQEGMPTLAVAVLLAPVARSRSFRRRVFCGTYGSKTVALRWTAANVRYASPSEFSRIHKRHSSIASIDRHVTQGHTHGLSRAPCMRTTFARKMGQPKGDDRVHCTTRLLVYVHAARMDSQRSRLLGWLSSDLLAFTYVFPPCLTLRQVPCIGRQAIPRPI